MKLFISTLIFGFVCFWGSGALASPHQHHVAQHQPISPFDKERKLAKSLVLENNYFLVHVNCSVAKCEERDVKGLYKKARNGEIKNFTGIDSPYEIPKDPNLIVDTEKENINESVDKIFIAIKNKIKG